MLMWVSRRRHLALHRVPAAAPTGQQQCWKMDFVYAHFFEGRPSLVLTAVEHGTEVMPKALEA